MIKKSYKNNIVLNYIYEFLLNRNFVQALWPTYLVFRGMSLIEVGVCESVFHLTSLFLKPQQEQLQMFLAGDFQGLLVFY